MAAKQGKQAGRVKAWVRERERRAAQHHVFLLPPHSAQAIRQPHNHQHFSPSLPLLSRFTPLTAALALSSQHAPPRKEGEESSDLSLLAGNDSFPRAAYIKR